ncbi:MAG: hypothetical protein Tsb0027_02270 [Wenzhouxiangellaceae bacterium]
MVQGRMVEYIARFGLKSNSTSGHYSITYQCNAIILFMPENDQSRSAFMNNAGEGRLAIETTLTF